MEIKGAPGTEERAYEIAEIELSSLLMELTSNYPSLARQEIIDIIRNTANGL